MCILTYVGMAQTNQYFCRGISALRSLGRMLLSSNIIYICVRVVMLVRMIRTRLFAVARVKSCVGMHSSYVVASSSGCARIVGRPPISGGGP